VVNHDIATLLASTDLATVVLDSELRIQRSTAAASRVFNLQPATLMGVESNGMVLAASPEGGKPVLLSFEDPPPPGSRVR